MSQGNVVHRRLKSKGCVQSAKPHYEELVTVVNGAESGFCECQVLILKFGGSLSGSYLLEKQLRQRYRQRVCLP